MHEPAPTTASGIEGLQALRAEPGRGLVALDFDGTLSPIVDDPAQARPIPGVREVLDRLAGRLCALAIVTGRPASVAVEFLGMAEDSPANVVVLGHYGLERWTPVAGIIANADVDASGVAAVRAGLPALLRQLQAPVGTSIEDKSRSVAVHVRRTADPAGAFELLRRPLGALAHEHRLRLEPGRLVWELRPAGIDKGAALESLARELGVRVVCYVGDDLGDVAAFEAVERLRESGVRGLTICVGSEVTELAARADLVLDGPQALVDFLDDIAQAFGR